MKRIFVNAVAARAGGGLRHITPFAHTLASLRPQWEIVVYAPRGVALTPDRFENLRHVATDVRQGVNAQKATWEQFRVRRLSRHFDVLLSPMNFGPLWIRMPHILWQRNPTYFDPLFYERLSLSHRLRFWAYRRYALACVPMADRIVVPSRAMLELLGRHRQIDERFVVIPHGHAPSGNAQGELLPEPADTWSRANQRLLYVSNPSAHKNVEALPGILSHVRQVLPDTRLAVTFPSESPSTAIRAFHRSVDRFGVHDGIDFLGQVQQDAVDQLYERAHVVLYPSLTESFGFPILEALSAGVPLVISDIPSNREVADGLARFHPPDDHREAAELVLRELLEPPDPRLVARRRNRARAFTWERSTRAVVSLIEDVT